MTDPLPRPLAPFVAFAALLRANAFPVSPDQTQAFITAVGLLGPRSMQDIHRAAHATLAPPPERRDEFDALFRLAFLGQTLAAPATGDETDEMEAFDDRDGGAAPPEPEEAEPSGGEPSGAERLFARAFQGLGETEALRRFRRAAPAALPRRRSRRRAPAGTRGRPDLRRALREAVRRDGEFLHLPRRARATRQRKIVLMIDVSGSMKDQTDAHLRFAHALVQSADRAEVFTLGTRLTRVTRALRRRNRDQALALAAGLVADWDGGTRLGEALHAFLAVPRFAGQARGALAIILSDGLERGDPAPLIASVQKLSRQAWGLLWLTPLASQGRAVETTALTALAPWLDRLGDGSSAERLCAETLGFHHREKAA